MIHFKNCNYLYNPYYEMWFILSLYTVSRKTAVLKVETDIITSIAVDSLQY